MKFLQIICKNQEYPNNDPTMHFFKKADIEGMETTPTSRTLRILMRSGRLIKICLEDGERSPGRMLNEYSGLLKAAGNVWQIKAQKLEIFCQEHKPKGGR